ncbi:EamA/RhaT family transporter [Xanthomonas oryzae pv. oryzae]|nr:EamA/RhaT family transporter [Xanthomonas oryzae pv. oryzae]
MSWSAYSIANARWLRRRPDLSGGDWSLLTGVVTGALALLLAPAALIGSAAHAPLAWAGFWGVSLMLGILASVIGNALWNRASRVLPLTLVGQMIVFETVFALLYGFAWEMRLPTPLELAAIACLLVGVLWCAALHAEAIMMSAADAHAPLPCRLHPAGTPPCASPAAIHRHAPARCAAPHFRCPSAWSRARRPQVPLAGGDTCPSAMCNGCRTAPGQAAHRPSRRRYAATESGQSLRFGAAPASSG